MAQGPAPAGSVAHWVHPLQAQLPQSPSQGKKATIEEFTAHGPGSTAHWAAAVPNSSRAPELLQVPLELWICSGAHRDRGRKEMHIPSLPSKP